MALQVLLLMWVRTAIHYQDRYGGNIGEVFSHLYSQGGVARFYEGLVPALIISALCRFGDTAANEGAASLMAALAPHWSVMAVTAVASLGAACWRVVIAPLDMLKTVMQVEGASGLAVLQARMAAEGGGVLFDGALGAWTVALTGHYTWFAIHNKLTACLREPHSATARFARNTAISLGSSLASDLVCNSLRILKIYKQTSSEPVSYAQAFAGVVAQEGLAGVLFRGLGVKVLSNGLSSVLFFALFRHFLRRGDSDCGSGSGGRGLSLGARQGVTRGRTGRSSRGRGRPRDNRRPQRRQ